MVMPQPRGGLEQKRRAMMLTDPELYQYIEAHVAARELERAGGNASGAVTGHDAANLIWALGIQWERKKQKILDQVAEEDL